MAVKAAASGAEQAKADEMKPKRKGFAGYICGGVVVALGLFAAGFLLRPLLLPQQASAQTVSLRVYDGELQWFDGVRWQSGGNARAAMETDPFGLAERPSGLFSDGAPIGDVRAQGNVPVAPRVSTGGGAAGGSSGGGDAGGAAGGGSTGGAPSTGDGEDLWSGDIL